MANNSFTPAEIEELRQRRIKLVEAYTSGASTISHNGKSVTFRSLQDIKSAIDAIDDMLGNKRVRVIKTCTHRGL